jgi:hypothetical protein
VTAMAVMNKQQAKQFAEMDDFFLDLLNLLKDKGIIDNEERKVLLLTGFEKLVQALEKKKVISHQDSKEAMAKGFTSLVYALAE